MPLVIATDGAIDRAGFRAKMAFRLRAIRTLAVPRFHVSTRDNGAPAFALVRLLRAGHLKEQVSGRRSSVRCLFLQLDAAMHG